MDLSVFFAEYEAIVHENDKNIEKQYKDGKEGGNCGRDSDLCCHETFEIKFIEAVYINNKLNKMLSSSERLEIIARAARLSAAIKNIPVPYLCPLNKAEKCTLYEFRPVRCRSYGSPAPIIDYALIDDMLLKISRDMFLALSGIFVEKNALAFPFYDVISGRFVQTYFHRLLKM